MRLVAADWRARETPYHDAHVFTLSRLSEQHLSLLSSTPELSARLRTLTELNLDFLALEAQTFVLGKSAVNEADKEQAGCTLRRFRYRRSWTTG